jgi:hypothetical protein
MASITERQRTIINAIQKEHTATREYLLMREKPLTAYQHYIKHMRARWNTLSEEERDTFMLEAKRDRERYENEKVEIEKKSGEEIKKLKIYLRYSGDRVPCVGLDNGFTRYTIVGPVNEIELFNKVEKKKLIDRGVPEEKIGIYKSVGGHKFNWRAAKKWGVTVYGGSQNYQPSWGGLLENYEGEAGNFTTYTNYKGESWSENY